jgi:hypothetical protein
MGRKFVYGILLALAVSPILAGGSAADWGKTETQVSCYIGARYDNEYLGTVDVFDARQAAQYCNMLYGDCNRNCTGCYTDEESRELCIDSSGAAYYF